MKNVFIKLVKNYIFFLLAVFIASIVSKNIIIRENVLTFILIFIVYAIIYIGYYFFSRSKKR